MQLVCSFSAFIKLDLRINREEFNVILDNDVILKVTSSQTTCCCLTFICGTIEFVSSQYKGHVFYVVGFFSQLKV